MQQTIKNGTFTAELTIRSYSIYRDGVLVAFVGKDGLRTSYIKHDEWQPFADIVTKCGREFLNG